ALDRRGQVPFHDLHVIDVILKEQIIGLNRLDDVQRLRGPAEEKTRYVPRVNRLDQERDACGLQTRRRVSQIPDKRRAGILHVQVRWSNPRETIDLATAKNSGVLDCLVDPRFEL